MPEKFCSTCRNTGYVVVRDQAETIRITKTRCPHCPPKPGGFIPPPRTAPADRAKRVSQIVLLVILAATVGLEILILVGGSK